MKTLLQINATCNYGSTGRISEQIAALAELNGWDCFIAHGGRYVRQTSIKTYQISSRIDNIVHAIKSIVFGRHGLGSKKATKRFVKWIDELKPDIIHIHNLHGYYLNYQLLFEYLSKVDIPIVWTFHDCWALTGQCTHFVEAACEKWKSGCHDCDLLQFSYKTCVDRTEKNWMLKCRLFNSVKKMIIVPVSKWLDCVVKESFLKGYPTCVINNGIDLSVFKPSACRKKDLGLDERFTLLGVSSGWGNSKGLEDFIELSKNPEYQIVLVGVQDGIIDKLPKEIKALKRTKNQLELVAYYSIADVFINPSHADSFPTVNLEALACGTPVITYRTGGSPEAIDEMTGAIVRPGDLNQLSLKISEFRTSNFKQVHSADCRNRAEEYFDKNKCYKKYLDLYNQLMID